MRQLNRESTESERAPGPPASRRLRLELDATLAGRLRRAARARGQPPHELAAALLARGLDKAALQAQAAAALEALTPRQQEVAWLIARGYTNHQIAEALVVSPETVKTHVHNVLENFEASSKAELRVLLLDLGVRWWETGAAPLPSSRPAAPSPNEHLDKGRRRRTLKRTTHPGGGISQRGSSHATERAPAPAPQPRPDN